MNVSENNTKTNVQLVSICMQMGLQGGERVVFMLVGEPGIAKTKGVEAITKSLSEYLKVGFPAEIWSGPQIQAEDAAGLPFPDAVAGVTRLLPLRIGLEVLNEEKNPGGAGIVCIDEFGSLSPAQEAAFLNLLQGGRLGEKVLPNKVALGAMMNPEDAGAAAGRSLSAAASNRLVWIPWTLDPHAWFDYMLGGVGLAVDVKALPEGWEKEYGHQAASLVVSYCKKNPGSIQNMPPEQDSSKAWPSFRSWETAARLLAAVMSTGERKESDLAHAAIAGCVGDGAGEAFMSWLINLNLPDPEVILANPDKAHKLLPTRNDHKGVALEAVAVAACQPRDDKKERWETAWSIVGPAFIKEHDVGMTAAKILAKAMNDYELKDAKHPPETREVVKILRKAGLIE
jgi:hypothetical protein